MCCKRHRLDVVKKCVALVPWGRDLLAHLLGTRPDFLCHIHGAMQVKRHGFESGVAMGNCELEQNTFVVYHMVNFRSILGLEAMTTKVGNQGTLGSLAATEGRKLFRAT